MASKSTNNESRPTTNAPRTTNIESQKRTLTVQKKQQYALSKCKYHIRETFFLNQLKVNYQVNASLLADFTSEGKDFEVGGKNKGLKQIKNADKGYIVKDNIESGYLNTIPLWHFGLMY